MKKLIMAAMVLVVAASAMAQSRATDRTADPPGRFVGAWRLAWLEEPAADGKIHRADCTGLLVYTRDGHMSVQVMYKNAQAASGAAPVHYERGGYEASFGRYDVNDAHTFTYHVEGALVRSLVGRDLPRVYEFSGNQLIVKSPDPKEHWRVAWERD